MYKRKQTHIQIQIQNAEIEDEARSKHIARLDFFKTVRAAVEEVGNPHFWVVDGDGDEDGDYDGC